MKKTKRLLALTLVLMMVMAIFALPAAAMYVERRPCPACYRSDNSVLWVDPEDWVNISSPSPCSHGTNGVDYQQRASCKLKCCYDQTVYPSVRYSVLCTSTGRRY